MPYARRCIRASCMLLAFVVAAAACAMAQSPQERMAQDRLAHARAAHSQAKADPEMQAEDMPALMDAEQTLNAATQVRDMEEINHLAYIGQRQTQIAVCLAHVERAHRRVNELRRENERLLE